MNPHDAHQVVRGERAASSLVTVTTRLPRPRPDSTSRLRLGGSAGTHAFLVPDLETRPGRAASPAACCHPPFLPWLCLLPRPLDEACGLTARQHDSTPSHLLQWHLDNQPALAREKGRPCRPHMSLREAGSLPWERAPSAWVTEQMLSAPAGTQ